MIIRNATTTDKEQLVQLMHEFDDYYYDEHIFTEEYLPFWKYKNKQKIFEETATEWLSDPSYLVFVSEENNELTGYIVGHVKERSPRVLDKEGHIDDWFVSKNWRHKGIGRQLYKKLLEEFKKHNCNRLGLLTNIRNKPTIDFYHKLGFIDESLTLVKELE